MRLARRQQGIPDLSQPWESIIAHRRLRATHRTLRSERHRSTAWLPRRPSAQRAASVGRLRLCCLVAVAAVAAAAAITPVAAPRSPAPVSIQLVRFGGGHFGSSRGFGFSSRPRIRRVSPLGRSSGRSRGLLRRIGHALAFAAVLHFLFAGSHGGGFIFLLLIIGLVVVLMRRRRRRRAYPRY